jgi:hypothetical protein
MEVRCARVLSVRLPALFDSGRQVDQVIDLIMMGDRDGVRRDPAVEAGEGVGDPDTIPRPTGSKAKKKDSK